MKELIVILTCMFLFTACDDDTVNEAIESDTELVVNIIPETLNNSVNSGEKDTIVDDSEMYMEIEGDSESSGITKAIFISASLVEGDVGLYFIEQKSGKELYFYHFDIDPVEEGLFTYEEVEGSVFPNLVTNPDIEDIPLMLHWQTEIRHIDLADEDAEVKVLKKIEK